MKRNIQAFWLEATLNGWVKVTILRDRRTREHLPSCYLPTASSLARINKVAKYHSKTPLSTYHCEPVDDKNVVLGWVLFRRVEPVYPPPMGTRNAGQKRQAVPSEASIL
jgi:hypothetical protein